MPDTPIIPETITVHLGPPDSNAENVTVPFLDYVANVASSEIYPTWPENALRANNDVVITVKRDFFYFLHNFNIFLIKGFLKNF